MLINDNLEGKVIDAHTFIGMMKLDLDEMERNDGIVELQLSMIGYDDINELDAEDNSVSHQIHSEWNLNVPFIVDTEAVKEIPIHKENEGYSLNKVFVSPYQIITYTDVPYTRIQRRKSTGRIMRWQWNKKQKVSQRTPVFPMKSV